MAFLKRKPCEVRKGSCISRSPQGEKELDQKRRRRKGQSQSWREGLSNRGKGDRKRLYRVDLNDYLALKTLLIARIEKKGVVCWVRKGRRDVPQKTPTRLASEERELIVRLVRIKKKENTYKKKYPRGGPRSLSTRHCNSRGYRKKKGKRITRLTFTEEPVR